MNFYNDKDKNEFLNSNKILANECLIALGLVETHFKELDGVKCRIASGESAKFKTIIDNFKIDYEANKKHKTLGGMCFFNVSEYSVYLTIKICVSNEAKTGCSYHSKDIYIGKVENNLFIYNCQYDGYIESFKSIKKTTMKQIQAATKKRLLAVEKINAIDASINHYLKDLIK